jgi:hypothetical protein
VVHPKDRVECGELGHEKLATTGSIPVNGVVDLFQRGTTAAGGSKLGKAVGMGQDIVLSMLTMLKMF